jgi:hypothetical protein
MVSSVEGGGGVGGVAVPLFGEEEPCFGGDGVSGRRLVGTESVFGGSRAGSEEAEGESTTDKHANAVSRSLEW